MYNGFLKVKCVTNIITLGNPICNAKEIIRVANGAKDEDILLFPELALTGYSCGDLFFTNDLINEVYEAIDYIVKNNNYEGLLVFGAPLISEGSLVNSAIYVAKDKILGVVPKYFLPNSAEYYEKRWFISGFNISKDNININNNIVPFGHIIITDNKHDVHIGLEICEDMWSMTPPSGILALNGCNVILNISASNEYLNKRELRRCAVIDNSRRNSVAYIYSSTNASDSTSDSVFSGHMIMAQNGTLLCENKSIPFETSTLEYDIDIDGINFARRKSTSLHITKANKDIYREINFTFKDKEFKLSHKQKELPFVPDNESGFFEIKEILELALYKRLKHTGMKHVVIGVSGGLDSTLALLVCYNTFKLLGLPRKNIIAVTMPGLGTSSRTKNNALDMMHNLDLTVLTKSIVDSVYKHFELIGHDANTLDVTYENTQARIRTLILMNLANMYNALVVGTGDMSELALGWCTYNGDQMSMYGLNAGVPKTLVRYLIKMYALNEFSDIKETLFDIIDTPISPELLGKDQKTEESIGKYEINDFILYRYLNFGDSKERLIYLLQDTFGISKEASNNYVEKFFKRFFTQQFKRQALPDGPKVLNVSLSSRGDFRIPSDIRR